MATHLLTQNKISMGRSFKGVWRCTYRGENGLKCAVGCLIADEHYNADLEGSCVATGNVIDALEHSGVPTGPKTVELLTALQTIHDFVAPENWCEYLAKLAKSYNLEMPQ